VVVGSGVDVAVERATAAWSGGVDCCGADAMERQWVWRWVGQFVHGCGAAGRCVACGCGALRLHWPAVRPSCKKGRRVVAGAAVIWVRVGGWQRCGGIEPEPTPNARHRTIWHAAAAAARVPVVLGVAVGSRQTTTRTERRRASKEVGLGPWWEEEEGEGEIRAT
jgi:hypothetical protein